MASLTALKITKENLEYNTDEKQNTVTTDIGTILLYAGTTIDNISSNFLLCDGSSYQNNDYIDLFGIIGNKYGGTVPNFNVPNFKMYMPIGPMENVNTIEYKSEQVTNGGNNFIESSQFKHDHSIPGNSFVSQTKHSNGDTNSNEPNRQIMNDYSRKPNTTTTNTLDNTDNPIDINAQNNHYPKYTTLNYIICYKT